MNLDWAIALVLALGLLAANLPFVAPRILLVGPRAPERSLGWRLLELLVLGLVCLGLAMFFEARVGQRHPQSWAFYVILLCLLLTFAFPGFVWRYLRRGDGR